MDSQPSNPAPQFPTDDTILLTVADLFDKGQIRTGHPDVTKYCVNRLRDIAQHGIPQAEALTLDAKLWDLAEKSSVSLAPSIVMRGMWIAREPAGKEAQGRTLREARNQLLVNMGLLRVKP